MTGVSVAVCCRHCCCAVCAQGPNLMPKNLVGFVAAVFFLFNSGCSYMWGKLIPTTGRRPIFVVTLVMHVAYYIIVYVIANGDTGLERVAGDSPKAGAVALVFANSIIFAIGDSVLESQLPAIIQSPTFFPEERDRDAANASLRLWQSLGFTVQFVIGVIWPNNVLLQTEVLFPMLLLALGFLFVLDRYVQPIDMGKKGYASVSQGDTSHGHASRDTSDE